MTLTSSELEMARQVADFAAGLVITFGLPIIGTWAVRKGLIQQRWATMIQAAAGAGLAAGNATGKSVDAPEFRKAAEAAVLAYAKSQAPDILKAKSLTDDMTIEAGMARVSTLTGGAIGPNGSAVSGMLPVAGMIPVSVPGAPSV